MTIKGKKLNEKGNTVLTNILAVNIYSENRPVTLAKKRVTNVVFVKQMFESPLRLLHNNTKVSKCLLFLSKYSSSPKVRCAK